MNNYTEQLVSVELVQVEKNKFAIRSQDKIYFVSVLMFELFGNLKKGLSLTETQQAMALKFDKTPDIEELKKIVEENLQKFLAEKTEEQKKANSYIYSQKKLFSQTSLAKITRVFSILFNRYVFIALFLASCTWSFLLLRGIFMRGGLFSTEIAWHDGIGLVLLSYAFLIGIAVFHEIGHASASKKYGIKAKEVGFGFYLFFPVLYTNVSEVWLLNRYKRILVNIGGIYFQLIVNGVLYFMFTQKMYHNVVASLFVTNSILILYSLNPFMRNDGYWIYSDIFDIPNLSATAFDYPLRAIHFLRGKVDTFHQPNIQSLTQKLALMFYSLVMYFLIMLLPIGLFKLSIHNFDNVRSFLTEQQNLHGVYFYEACFKISKTLVVYSLMIFFSLRMFRMIIRKYSAI